MNDLKKLAHELGEAIEASEQFKNTMKRRLCRRPTPSCRCLSANTISVVCS